jgi:hypothetical protein
LSPLFKPFVIIVQIFRSILVFAKSLSQWKAFEKVEDNQQWRMRKFSAPFRTDQTHSLNHR